MSEQLKDVQDSTDVTQMLASMISATQGAMHGLSCAAYIWGRFAPHDKDDSLIRGSMIKAFNIENRALAETLANAKTRFVSRGSKAPARLLKDAEADSNIADEQNVAADHLLQGTVFLILRSADTSDPNAKSVEFLNITCDEKIDILERAKQISGSEGTAYNSPAKLIAGGMEKYKCR